MNVTEHQRPGVYSVYDASSAVSGRRGGRTAGVAAICTASGVTAGKAYDITGVDQAETAFGTGETINKLIRLLMRNGAGRVYAVPVASASGYEAAFGVLEKIEEIGVVVCDSTDVTVQQKLKASVTAASAARQERLAVVGAADNETAANLVSRADSLNCERVVLAAPGGIQAAAALAGAICGESDPALPVGGIELKDLTAPNQVWTDTEIDTLVLGGVTPLEVQGGVVNVVRGITTRTKTGSASDATWRELTTIRVVDDVIPTLRNALRAKFSRAKNTEQGRGAIRSQVIVELENKLRREIIAGYDDVMVSALADDPTVCLVEFKFTVANGLNQVWLSAHITV